MNKVSLDDYVRMLVDDIKSTIEKQVKEEAKKGLRDAINETVYLRQKTYRPTYDLLDAVEITNFKMGTKVASFSIVINATKLNPEIRMPNEWNAHVGIDGQSFRDVNGLVEVLDQGTKSHSFYMHDGYGFFEKAHKNLEVSLVQAMATSLRTKGWKVQVS